MADPPTQWAGFWKNAPRRNSADTLRQSGNGNSNGFGLTPRYNPPIDAWAWAVVPTNSLIDQNHSPLSPGKWNPPVQGIDEPGRETV